MKRLAVGKYIKRKRLERGLTQEELVKRLGVNKFLVDRWESGQSVPTGRDLEALSKELSISPEDVYSCGIFSTKKIKLHEEEVYTETKLIYRTIIFILIVLLVFAIYIFNK